jgi:hypothetical protein
MLKDMYFKDAVWIFYLANKVVVEYPEMTTEAFKRKLSTLPRPVSNCIVPILFRNGFLAGVELGRKTKPQAQHEDGVVD